MPRGYRGCFPTRLVIHREFVLPDGEKFWTRIKFSPTRKDVAIVERICTHRCFANAALKGEECQTVTAMPGLIDDGLWIQLKKANPRYHPEAAGIIEKYATARQEWRDRGGLRQEVMG